MVNLTTQEFLLILLGIIIAYFITASVISFIKSIDINVSFRRSLNKYFVGDIVEFINPNKNVQEGTVTEIKITQDGVFYTVNDTIPCLDEEEVDDPENSEFNLILRRLKDFSKEV